MFKFLRERKKDNKGFTLVELVIVIAILAILVGILAPQYTKYVEKSRKAADATNMDEIVKVIRVFAGDEANEMPADTYTVTIGAAASDTKVEAATADGKALLAESGALKKELDTSVPNWSSVSTKSKKWGANGAKSNITAAVTVNSEGGVSVTYGPKDSQFESYMAAK